ncbi:hypothetical protein CCAX7_49010 [Capsulimonas corticalis]|uniref:Uncharacterized protein n=1 Tax=Capsulimonas corticalis TaxID=2219043 RepID=A0A402CQ52_9BACT|nr:HupE/UreJ family protein [Capsulimonas corticalis]BDI32850.1 hypothetical protein CCAX7_49010 [Capsulimonas corticalis]
MTPIRAPRRRNVLLLALALMALWTGLSGARCSAHPANFASATAKIAADRTFTVNVRFDLLAFTLNDTPFRIGDAPMNALLDGPPEALQSSLAEAAGRFRNDFQTNGGVVDSVAFPTLADIQAWRDSGVKPRLPVLQTVTVAGHLAPGAKTIAFRFPEVLGMIVLTSEVPYQEPVSEPLDAGAMSTAVSVTPGAPLPIISAPPAAPASPVQPIAPGRPQPPEPSFKATDTVVTTHDGPKTTPLTQRRQVAPSHAALPIAAPAPNSPQIKPALTPPASTAANAGKTKAPEDTTKRIAQKNAAPPASAPPNPLSTPPSIAPPMAVETHVFVVTTAPKHRWSKELLGFVKMGFTHILPEGLDHILFVLGLFLLSTKLKPLLWQITAFTVAHSLTLGLSLYGIVRLPSSIIEPVIAASIAFVAIENICTTELKPWRPFVVFAFGLVHGMGFAGALKDLGLQKHDFLTALVGFNVGVELGQLSVVALAFLCVGWFRKRANYRRIIVVPASAIIAAIAVFWTIQRTI